MNIGGLRRNPCTVVELDRLLDAARSAAPTYDHIGSTLDPGRRSEPRIFVRHLDVGRGTAAFTVAREALRTWVPHAGIGADIHPAGQAVEVDATLLVVLRRGPLLVVAPDRIVGVIDEARRFAFAYGTLPGHPERGEESFCVEHLADDTVRATIRVQAGPGSFAAHAVAPAVRALQHAAVHGYLRAIADHVTANAPPNPPAG